MRRFTSAQIQVGETLMVIFVFILLLVFGLYWFNSYGQAEAVVEQDTQARLQLLEKTKEIMNMPEYQCSIAGKTDSSCLDLTRIRAFKALAGEGGDDALRERYQDRFFGYEVAVETLYPEDNPVHPGIEIFNYGVDRDGGSQKAAVPVVLYDPLTEDKTFSMLVITQYTGDVQ